MNKDKTGERSRIERKQKKKKKECELYVMGYAHNATD